jgi:hypothetical protein
MAEVEGAAALLLRFRARNTLELKDGKCACVSCRKLFRSIEFLSLHFEKMHALEILALKQRAAGSPHEESPQSKSRAAGESEREIAPGDDTE